MKSWTLCLVLAIGAVACHRPNPNLQGRADHEKQKLANEVRHKVASQLKDEAQLRPCGTIGQMLNEIQILGLTFYYYKPVDIVEGRKLLLKSVDTMLQEVNRETRIHPYLTRCPFKPRNVEIQIFLFNPDGKDVAPGSLYVIEASEGVFRYDIHHPTKSGFITIYKETYDEALQRLADPSLPLVPFEPDPETSPEELSRLRQGISFVSDDGSIWHLSEDGCWVRK